MGEENQDLAPKEEQKESKELLVFVFDFEAIKTVDDVKEILAFLAPSFTAIDRSKMGRIKHLVKELESSKNG